MADSQDSADEAQESSPVGEDADDVGSSADLLVEPLKGVIG